MRRLVCCALLACGPLVCASCDDGDSRGDPDGPAPVEVDLPPGGQAAYVDVRLEPRQPFYTQRGTPQLTAAVYDRDDVALDAQVTWHVEPPGAAEIGPDGSLRFIAQGGASAWGCVAGGQVCGVAHFYVDDEAPTLQVDVPTRAARVVGPPRILVAGTVLDSSPVDVYVNDELAEREGDRFRVELDARFGLNRVEVAAYDGVRPPTTELREVLWSPELLPVDADGVSLDRSLALRVDQALLDGDRAVGAPDETGLRVAPDLAAALQAALSASDPLGLAPNSINAAGVSVRLLAARVVDPEVDIDLEADGVNLFVRAQLELETSGSFSFEGRQIGLAGTLRAVVAAGAELGLDVSAAGDAALSFGGVTVAVEGLGGAFEDPAAQAVLETLGSTLRGAVEAYARQTVDDLVRAQVTDLLDAALGRGLDLLGALRVPPPGPPMELGFRAQPVEWRRRTGLLLGLRGEVRHLAPINPPHETRGVPIEPLTEAPPWPSGGRLGLAIRMAAFNALLHELWRAGALQLQLDQIEGLGPLRVTVDARLPPILVGGTEGGPFPLILQLGEVDLLITNGVVEALYSVSLRAGLRVEPGEGKLRLGLTDEPDVRVSLVGAPTGPAPIPPEGLQTLIKGFAWGQLREVLGAGLEVPLDAVELGPEILGGFTPGLGALRLVVEVPGEVVVRDGWLAVPADLRVELTAP